MISTKLKSIIFNVLERFRTKRIKNLEVTSFNSLSLFPDVSYFKSYEQELFIKITSGKIKGNVISMGSCFSEQIGFLLNQKSSKQYKIYENTETNSFFFNADWGRIYSPVSLLELLKFYTGNEDPKILKVPVPINTIISERKFKNIVRNETDNLEQSTSFIDIYREHLMVSGNKDSLLKSLQEHKTKAIQSIKEASNIFITFGTLEYWEDKEDNNWSVRPSSSLVNTCSVRNKILSLDKFRDILSGCIDEIKILNPSINIYLFITPVPLFATFTELSSLERFFYDSSVILLAMRSLISNENHVLYLPIFESILIDNPIIRENDMRHITNAKLKSILSNIF